MFDLAMASFPPVVGGIVDFPTFAAFVSWFLVAALVGSALGILREATGPHSRSATPSEPPVAFQRPLVHPGADHAHRVAA